MNSTIGTISYSAGAAAFALLSVLLVMSWRGRFAGAVLVATSVVAAIWNGSLAFQAANAIAHFPLGLSFEVLRAAFWFAFLALLLDSGLHARQRTVLRWPLGLVAVYCVAMAAYGLFGGSTEPAADGFPRMSVPLIGGFIGLSLVGMALVEQLYRNAHPERRWGIKFLALGIGGMFAFDFALYSEALLFKRVSVDLWQARGLVNALVVPLVAISAGRNPTWSLELTVSRRVLFHSATLIGAGVYLLVMAAAGYYIRYFGGSWGGVLQAAFLFGALLLLMVLLFSGTMRAQLRVFLSKNFFAYRYDYRDEWLRFTSTLAGGEPGVRLHERSIQAIAELVESPGGVLFLRREQEGGYALVARLNQACDAGVESANGPLANFLRQRQWVIDLDEFDANPEHYRDLNLPEWLRSMTAAWLIVPLIVENQLLGFVVLTRSRGKFVVNWEVNDLLRTAGRQAASFLAQVEAARELLVARQFEAFNRMSAFVIHDLKNLVAQLSLIVTNAAKHRSNPEFMEDVIQTVQFSVEKMNRLLGQLRITPKAVDPPAPLELGEVVASAVADKASARPKPALEQHAPGLTVLAHRERLERIVGHLIQNAVEATPGEGRVAVRVSQENGSAVIEVEDNGRGMSEEFMRDQLFRPFGSSKPNGMGIGAYEIHQYVRELGGSVQVASEEARGSLFRVCLPLWTNASLREPNLEGRVSS
jgi:putative PEP-CTERM system histidine kinase